VIDPSDGQPFDEIQRSTADDIDAAVHAARQCYHAVWQKMAPPSAGACCMALSAKVGRSTPTS
jgi:aldehyde dehydrogenase (NAD+)